MVSIIVPIYKVEKYLPHCIESIINQTYQDIEIILVDDGSPDNCGKICDNYSHKDKRIRVFHKINGGLSDARNFGITRANGEYIAFIDSDDWIEPDMVDVLVKTAEDNKADIVECGFFYEYSKHKVIDSGIDKKYDNTVDLIKGLVLGQFKEYVWNKLYRKSCFTNIAFPKGRVFEDIATSYLIFLKSTSAVIISTAFYHYRVKRQDSITKTTTMKNLTDMWVAHKSRYDYFLKDVRFNTDKEFMDKLLFCCATAIARTWRCCYANTEEELRKYAICLQEMQSFSIQKLPLFGIKQWPLYLRLSIFMCRYNNKVVFSLLFYMLQAYRCLRVQNVRLQALRR